jgi:hypothetical protein
MYLAGCPTPHCGRRHRFVVGRLCPAGPTSKPPFACLQKGDAAAAAEQKKLADGRKVPAMRGNLFYKVTVKVGLVTQQCMVAVLVCVLPPCQLPVTDLVSSGWLLGYSQQSCAPRA